MAPRTRKPQWWQLYLGLPLLCGLFVLEIRLHLSETDNVLLQLGILLVILLFLQAWLRANRGALMEVDEDAPERREQWGMRLYQFPPAERVTGTRIRTVRTPQLDIPAGELKGVMSTTYGMQDQPDEQSYDVPQMPLPEEFLGAKANTSGKE